MKPRDTVPAEQRDFVALQEALEADGNETRVQLEQVGIVVSLTWGRGVCVGWKVGEPQSLDGALSFVSAPIAATTTPVYYAPHHYESFLR